MNTPYDPTLHLPLLKAAAPGLRPQPSDAFGMSPSNANWAAIEVPHGQREAFSNECARLNIYAGWDSAFPGYTCRKLCRYVRDEAPARLIDAQIRQTHGHAGGLK